MIEDFIKKRNILEEQEKDLEIAEDENEGIIEITDEDLINYRQLIEEQKDIDNNEFEGGEE